MLKLDQVVIYSSEMLAYVASVLKKTFNQIQTEQILPGQIHEPCHISHAFHVVKIKNEIIHTQAAQSMFPEVAHIIASYAESHSFLDLCFYYEQGYLRTIHYLPFLTISKMVEQLNELRELSTTFVLYKFPNHEISFLKAYTELKLNALKTFLLRSSGEDVLHHIRTEALSCDTRIHQSHYPVRIGCIVELRLAVKDEFCYLKKIKIDKHKYLIKGSRRRTTGMTARDFKETYKSEME